MHVLKQLTAAPHRSFFFLGSLQLIAAMLVWVAVLEIPSPLPLLWPPSALHAWSMVYGVLSPFVFGFLFTALPNWVNGPPVPRDEYLIAAIMLAVGCVLFYPSLVVPGLSTLALGLHLGGWAIALVALLRVLRAAPAGDNRQPWAAWFTVLLGLAGDAAYFGWSLSLDDRLLVVAEPLALWGFLTPLFLVVCYRMIPYFTSRVVSNYVVIRPYPVLWALLTACFGHALLTVLGMHDLTWLTDFPLALISFWLMAVWGIRRSLHVRLLGMLHIAFVWAGVSFALFGLDSLSKTMGRVGLGFAPTHALAIGFFTSMLIGMATRVSLGHSGRKLECDTVTWRLFLTIQVAAVVRMLPDLFPGLIDYRVASLAGLIWLIALGTWLARYAPIYWRPRVDGRPG